jgi:hypothetical protein
MASEALPREGTCKLCGKLDALVKSHIIPRSFFDLEEDQRGKLISNVAGLYPRKAPAGVWDRIVCEQCERSFSEYDSYAAKVLVQDLNSYKRVSYRGKPVALIASGINYHLLKLFAIAVLWRASVASHDFYSRVRLGPFEEQARSMLLASEPGEINEFATWWSVFNINWTPGIMDPFHERWSGINAYRFYFGRVLGYIKVDRQNIPSEFREIAMAPARDLVLIARDFENSKDLRAMGTLLRTAVRGQSGRLF